MTKRLLSLLLLFISFVASAQESVESQPQMADKFRDDGKIYVVITVISIIFISIVVFLIALERKVKKLEQQIETKNDQH
jgi:uncharacterized protein (DUF983 family)